MRKIALKMGDGFLEGKGNDFKQGDNIKLGDDMWCPYCIVYELTLWLICNFGCTQIACKDTLAYLEEINTL